MARVTGFPGEEPFDPISEAVRAALQQAMAPTRDSLARMAREASGVAAIARPLEQMQAAAAAPLRNFLAGVNASNIDIVRSSMSPVVAAWNDLVRQRLSASAAVASINDSMRGISLIHAILADTASLSGLPSTEALRKATSGVASAELARLMRPDGLTPSDWSDLGSVLVEGLQQDATPEEVADELEDRVPVLTALIAYARTGPGAMAVLALVLTVIMSAAALGVSIASYELGVLNRTDPPAAPATSDAGPVQQASDVPTREQVEEILDILRDARDDRSGTGDQDSEPGH